MITEPLPQDEINSIKERVAVLEAQVAVLQAQVAALEAWKTVHTLLNLQTCEAIYWASRKHWRPGALLRLRKQLELLCGAPIEI
jgi:hypothetical protein